MDVDVSTYPRSATAPVNALDVVKNLAGLQQQKQQIESGGLTIEKQKLDNANQALGYLSRALTAIGSDGTKDQYKKAGQDAARQFNIPPAMQQVWNEKIDAAPTPKAFFDETVSQIANHQEMVNYHLGQQGLTSDGQKIYPTTSSPKFGVKITGPGQQIQIPPTTEIPVEGGVQQLGASTLPGSTSLPVAPRAGAGGVAPVAPNTPSGPMVGRPPAYDIGLKQRAEDQEIALARSSAIKPALQVLPLLEGLRSGPGTEPWTKAVAFLKANNIISTEQENDPTVIRQIVDKKLAQYVGGSPLSNRSDAGQALAEAGSPSAKVQLNPALEKLTKDAVALDRLRIALPGAFKKTLKDAQGKEVQVENKDYSQYGSHRSTFPTSMDERAFSLDLMKDDARAKLIDSMSKKLQSNEAKDKNEATKFFKSLRIANDHGIY